MGISIMWKHLDKEKKEKYRILMTNFASLSEAFSQKNESEEGEKNTSVAAPIINSKFQETAFQRAFDAIGEDIANTSYDASVEVDDTHKYLVGIKSFGIASGDQKIAQFKASSVKEGWSKTLVEAREKAEKISDKKKADEENKKRYSDVAMRIAKLRNERIASSKAQIKGFDASDEISVEAVYHVLMPSKKGEKPKIYVGETEYRPIDIEKIEILGATTLKNAANFKFSDGYHEYKYTDADSQLLMNFHNKDIVQETWNIDYVDDAFYFFENIHQKTTTASKERIVEETVSWMIADQNGHVEENSGFNGFDGATKLAAKNNYREQRIESFRLNYKDLIGKKDMTFIVSHLEDILLKKYPSIEDKRRMKFIRKNLRDKVIDLENDDIKKSVFAMVYRPVSEMYIPIPDSRNFHNEHPDFFGEKVGTFKEGTNKLALDKEHRKFDLEFLSSGDIITAYINQDNGKGIQSTEKQSVLGDWILRGVFQLDEYERLTGEKLDELGINSIRLSKFSNEYRKIGLEFTWMDIENPPDDAIGWVVESRNKTF